MVATFGARLGMPQPLHVFAPVGRSQDSPRPVKMCRPFRYSLVDKGGCGVASAVGGSKAGVRRPGGSGAAQSPSRHPDAGEQAVRAEEEGYVRRDVLQGGEPPVRAPWPALARPLHRSAQQPPAEPESKACRQGEVGPEDARHRQVGCVGGVSWSRPSHGGGSLRGANPKQKC